MRTGIDAAIPLLSVQQTSRRASLWNNEFGQWPSYANADWNRSIGLQLASTHQTAYPNNANRCWLRDKSRPFLDRQIGLFYVHALGTSHSDASQQKNPTKRFSQKLLHLLFLLHSATETKYSWTDKTATWWEANKLAPTREASWMDLRFWTALISSTCDGCRGRCLPSRARPPTSGRQKDIKAGLCLKLQIGTSLHRFNCVLNTARRSSRSADR